jgi:hypothetical protein
MTGAAIGAPPETATRRRPPNCASTLSATTRLSNGQASWSNSDGLPPACRASNRRPPTASVRSSRARVTAPPAARRCTISA